MFPPPPPPSPRAAPGFCGWHARVEAWLDARGKGAWIAAMVLAFVLFWPLGLVLLADMIWSRETICSSARRRCGHRAAGIDSPSGNTAFDAYRTDTLARLEREQADFEAFPRCPRAARDKAEFDQFMDERARTAAAPDAAAGDAAAKAG